MKTSKRSIYRRLAASLLALCMCVGGVASITTPAYAAASATDTGGGYYVERPGYLLMSNLSTSKTFTLRWKQVSGASGYQVQVSKYSDFSSVIRGSIVRSSTSSITVKITPRLLLLPCPCLCDHQRDKVLFLLDTLQRCLQVVSSPTL